MFKKGYFSKFEIILWICSVSIITASFFAFSQSNVLNLIASLIGVTSLIFNAKANPIGQVLMIVFSILYGIISLSFKYYGEMITYLAMTMPMAAIALAAWLKNPHNGNKSETKINVLRGKETAFMLVLTVVVSAIFYFILAAFKTPNIIPSTISVATSFAAAYLTFRRSAYFALAYTLNDIVLILLWTLASIQNPQYISVIICFAAFLVNDLYGFVNWKRIKKRQSEKT